MTRPLMARLGDKVDFEGEGGCWNFTGCLVKGYGQMAATSTGGHIAAHRAMFENYYGQIPAGLELDHLCLNTRCVNPEHLEPVTRAENLRRSGNAPAVNARKTHCAHGHAFNADNTRQTPEGKRECITCRRLTNRRSEDRRLEARRAAREGAQA